MNAVPAQEGSRTAAPLVVVAGGSSPAGIAVAAALVAAGLRVLMVGSDAGRIQAAAQGTGGAVPLSCDLGDRGEVAALGARIRTDHGAVDGLLHLVGGWRGGGTLVEQSDADFDHLQHSVLTTLRNTSREFHADLAASRVGRLAIVSSTAVTAPTPANANYAAIKAAAETWVQAIAAGFTNTPAAAVVLVVKALVDQGMRDRSPARSFDGFTDVAVLGQAAAQLFARPAATINGARIIVEHNNLT
ncbi:SDR family NAD(P)-dependent oxidoreductase [Specibacter sp. NPDC057265]|uniref:SDR family NAD(P)-dependent oxidoreductase n=1 Tax=Specibacter sp. NPDC057265 TaxID=3346075 RepID=UPI0036258312